MSLNAGAFIVVVHKLDLEIVLDLDLGIILWLNSKISSGTGSSDIRYSFVSSRKPIGNLSRQSCC